MEGVFSKYLSKEEWLIREEGWLQDELGVSESRFTLGNGYLGMRGIYEEIPEGTEPGTYIAGVFDSAMSMAPELVNAPNVIDFRIVVEGEKLDVGRMKILENERVLDLKNGLLARKTLFADTKNRRFLYESLRFLSFCDFHTGAMQVCLKALDSPAKIIVQDALDDSVSNIGSVLEGRKKHAQLVEVSTVDDMNYFCVKTFTRKIWIAYATFLAAGRGSSAEVGTLNRIFNMTLEKGERACFKKLFSVCTSRDTSQRYVKTLSINELRSAKRLGFDGLLTRHIGSWDKAWEKADVNIDGDNEVQKALRFNIYHLLISGNEKNENVSIGARALSGPGYRGHTFWDTELFILPFFTYTNPKIAKNLLLYRFRRLDEAKKIARSKGFKGALFPWESADKGDEAAAPYSKSLDGSIVENETAGKGCHVVSAVTYGLGHYFAVTDDIEFMLEAGLELTFECARFWASRVSYQRREKRFWITGVTGPDGFHKNVDNSFYINKMAQWNLYKAKGFYEHFEKKYPRHLRKLGNKLSLSENEVKNWAHIADRIKMPFSQSKGVFPEFDGYLKLKDVPLRALNRYFMPILPRRVSILDFGKTQLVKQADIVMLMFLLVEEFTKEEKSKNYAYYANRTLHKSSLSPSMYSILASEVGDRARGYLFFLFSLHADLKNLHGNTEEGIHIGGASGAWQAAINGFAGLRVMDGMPSLEPNLPRHWKNISFNLQWKDCELKLSVNNDRINILAESKKKKDFILVKCFNSVHKIMYNQKYELRKR